MIGLPSKRALVGGVLTAVAVAILGLPRTVLRSDGMQTIWRAVTIPPSQELLLGIGSIFGLYLLIATRREATDTESVSGAAAEFRERATQPVEAAVAGDRSRVGEEFDSRVKRLDGTPQRLQTVQEPLREAAIEIYAIREDVDEQQAATELDEAMWTDDRVAGAVLSTDDAVTPPVWSRLRYWADPEAEQRRRVRKTMDAIQRDLVPDEWES